MLRTIPEGIIARGSRERNMLWIVFAILFGAWLVALLTSFTLGGFIHLLLIIALTIVLVQFMDTRRMV
jgi:hypothetical protein